VLLLEQAGHAVLQARDAEAGIALARSDQPALILMDIQLPGLDGLGATRELKSDPRTASIPVIALTAFAMNGDDRRIIEAGCDGYIAKPLRYRELLAVIERKLAAD
jgi:two-component system cell cycle response regulator DivK